jgi:hypothetical protein
MLTEALNFYEPAERMPDSDLTVILRLRNNEEPVWLGFHDGEEWRDLDGQPVEVVRWAELPVGGEA